MQAMIFAAGLGTRLQPITNTIPKAMVRVGNMTLIERNLTALREAGFGHIVVNVHHFAQKLRNYLVENNYFNCDVAISDERKQLLDTGGGLKYAASNFRTDEPILIHNVDILSNVDLRKFYEDNSEADATLLVSERETSRYLLFDDNMRLVGWTNVKTGEIKSPFKDLKLVKCRQYAFSGIHIFSPRLFPLMESFPDVFGIIDFYLSVCNRVNIKGCLKRDLQLMDVGKLSTLDQAADFVKSIQRT
jgi:MurNAc alpha-1-phosphate uridylyltransferase